MQKHILIIGGPASVKSRKAEEIVNSAPFSIVQIFTGTFHPLNFDKIKFDTVPNFIIFEDMSPKTFLSEQAKHFYTKDKIVIRKPYSSIYEEFIMPKLIFVVTAKLSELGDNQNLRRFDIIDLNFKENKTF